MRKIIAIIVIAIFIIFIQFQIKNYLELERYVFHYAESALVDNKNNLPKAGDVSLERYIFNMAGEDGLQIAKCESSLNPNARSKTSSAKGLFQFIDKTWENYCEGDVFDPIANTRCFVKLYHLHPTWWECS